MKLFNEMTDLELEAVNLVEFTRLSIGDVVTHYNAGKHGGNGTIISSQKGKVIGHQNQGLHHWGGLCVTVDVLWADGSESRIDYKFAVKS